ncbi:hypothetical protein [Flavobacterium sp. AJR]|jgi:hypothetical protein|nr:hypothetical protein [Flavobacterium sp. AJR]
MDNLKKFEFEKLDSSEMKQVQGGGLLDEVGKLIVVLEPIIAPLLNAVA